MADKRNNEGALASLLTALRNFSSSPEVNAINRGLASAPMLPWELSKKATSFIPGLPSYEFGSDTEDLYRKMRGAGMLSDRPRGTGWNRVLENTLETGAGGLGFGAALRAPAMLMAGGKGAFASAPALREQARQLALYDVGMPAAVEPVTSTLDQSGNEGAASITRLFGPLAASGLIPQIGAGLSRIGGGYTNDAARTEATLRRLERRTGPATELRTPENMEGLRVSVPEMIPSSGTSLRDVAADAYRRSIELAKAAKSPEGRRKLIADRLANRQTIQQMPFENMAAEDIGAAARGTNDALTDVINNAPTAGASTGQIAKAVADRTQQIAKDLYSKLPGSGGGYERMADKIIDLMKQAQAAKNADYAALGDMTKLGKVNRDPLYQAWEQILKDKKASAALNGGLGDELKAMKTEMDLLLNKNLDATEREMRANMGIYSAGGGPAYKAVNVSNEIPIADLVERRKYLNSLKLTPTGEWIRAKLINAIDDTIGQNAPVRDALASANSNYSEYRKLIDPSTPYGKAFSNNNLEDAKKELALKIRNVFTGTNSGGQADELADLFSKFSNPNELQDLFRGALGDTIALKAKKIGALPGEAPTNVKSARGELNAAQAFAQRIGIPLDEMNNMGVKLATEAEVAAKQMEPLKRLADNPRSFMAKGIIGTPEEQLQVRNVIQELGAHDPKLATALDSGLTQATKSHAVQQAAGQNLGELSRDPFMFVSRAVGGTPQESQKVSAALGDAMNPPVGPSQSLQVENDIAKANRATQGHAEMGTNLQRAGIEANAASGFNDIDLANMAALGGAASGVSPFTVGRGVRLAESVVNKVAHPLTDTNLYGALLSDPGRYMGLINSNPTYHIKGYEKLLPQVVGTAERVFSPSRSEEIKAQQAQMHSQPAEILDWGDGESTDEQPKIDTTLDWGE